MLMIEKEKSDYEAGSWRAWEAERRYYINQPDRIPPSPKEIKERAETLMWLKSRNFPHKLIVSVMWFNQPSIVLVRRLTRLHGPTEAFRRIEPFLTEIKNDS